MSVLAPLSDITNIRRVQSNIAAGCHASSPLASVGRGASCDSTIMSPEAFSPLSVAGTFTQDYTTYHSPSFSQPSCGSTFTHDPYNWKCVPDTEIQCKMILAQRAAIYAQRNARRVHVQTAPIPDMTPIMEHMSEPTTPTVPSGPINCRTLVQFKCHQAEYSSTMSLDKGQYVAVQGDRGMDIGVVIRVNTDSSKTFIERTGPCGQVMRHATQREVDYWASELKADEATALDFCRRRVIQHDLPMEVRHAEYQFDKKKLTFYYDAKTRVDFVTLLKELYREFGCRIWMEKVRQSE